jgi:hypothetical protein
LKLRISKLGCGYGNYNRVATNRISGHILYIYIYIYLELPPTVYFSKYMVYIYKYICRIYGLAGIVQRNEFCSKGEHVQRRRRQLLTLLCGVIFEFLWPFTTFVHIYGHIHIWAVPYICICHIDAVHIYGAVYMESVRGNCIYTVYIA